MHNPLVSVIIPNFNHARYLDERIQSVLNQTYKNFEVIILDDCSPDNGASKSIIEKYRSNPHVSHIVYNKINGGSPYKQWQKGANLANGELLWIAESDDNCDEHFLKELVPQFKEKKLSIAFCRSILFTDDKIIGPGHPISIEERKYSGSEFIREYLIEGCGIVNASCALFKKEAFLTISDIYRTYRGSGDRMFWILLAEKGDVAFVEKPYNYFRQHIKNTTKKLTNNGLMQKEDKRTYDYLRSKGYISDLEAPRYVRDFMLRNVFEMLTDKKVQQEIYEVWGFSRWQLLKLRFYVWMKKLKQYEIIRRNLYLQW